MVRVSEKELDEIARTASNCVEQSGYRIGIGYSYGHTNIELYKLNKEGRFTMERSLDTGLTSGEAALALRFFIQGCHYGKIVNPKWKWEGK